VYRSCIDELQQQLLKEGAHIIGLAADDPLDLAPKAEIRASSEHVSDDGETMTAANATDGYPRAAEEHTHAWSPSPKASGAHWIEFEWDAPVTFNVVHVCFQKVGLEPESFGIDVWQDGAWRGVARVEDNRHRRHVWAWIGLRPPGCVSGRTIRRVLSRYAFMMSRNGTSKLPGERTPICVFLMSDRSFRGRHSGHYFPYPSY